MISQSKYNRSMVTKYNILVLDPAESTGFSVVSVDEAVSTGDIFEYGYINVDTTSNYMGDWHISLTDQVEVLIKKYDAKMVVIEDYFFSSRFTSGSNVNPGYRAVIHMKVRQLGIPYEILNISQWKSFVAGRSVPTKEQKAKWGKAAANKLYMLEALQTRHGIRMPNHSLSEKTGKPIKFRYDIVDAVAQAICYCKLMVGIRTMTCSVVVPPDVDWDAPKPTKKLKKKSSSV